MTAGELLEPGGNIGLTTRRSDPLVERLRVAYLAVEQAAPEGEREAEKSGLIADLTTVLTNRNRNLADALAAIREAHTVMTTPIPDGDPQGFANWLALPAVSQALKEPSHAD